MTGFHNYVSLALINEALRLITGFRKITTETVMNYLKIEFMKRLSGMGLEHVHSLLLLNTKIKVLLFCISVLGHS